MNIDLQLFNALHDLAGISFTLDALGVFCARYLSYLLGIAGIIWAFRFRAVKEKILAFIMMGLTTLLSKGLITELIRFAYDRPRPFLAMNFEPLIPKVLEPSFPSGHAAFFFGLAAAIWLVDRNAGAWFFLFAFLNGLARVFVGVHYPADILSGAAIGILSAYLVFHLIKTPIQKTFFKNRQESK